MFPRISDEVARQTFDDLSRDVQTLTRNFIVEQPKLMDFMQQTCASNEEFVLRVSAMHFLYRALQNRWTKGAFARDANGNEVFIWSPLAVCWCAEGALKRCRLPRTIDDSISSLFDRRDLNQVAAILFGQDMTAVNDDLGHAAVMQMYDKAIELARDDK
jgi:hypothetical protein